MTGLIGGVTQDGVVNVIPSLSAGQIQVVSVKASPGLRAYVVDLAHRAEAVRRGIVEPDVDNLLKITSDGRKASIFNNTPGVWLSGVPTKIEACAERVWRHYLDSDGESGTQLVFCDLFTPHEADMSDLDYLATLVCSGGDTAEDFLAHGVYGRLKTDLVSKGILPGEIVFAHDFKSARDRAQLHDMIRKGIVRVCIGSTALIGIAINVQDRVFALHNLDCPWRPDELEQRLKRGIRQGNMWSEIHAYVYVTEGSYDPVVWQIVEGKARWISQLLSGRTNRKSTDDIGAVVLTASLAKAIALGDTRVLDKTRLETELLGYENRWLTWQNGRSVLRRSLDSLPREIDRLKQRAEYSARCASLLTNEPLWLLGGGAGGGDGSDKGFMPTSYQDANAHVRALWFKHVNSRKRLPIGLWKGFRLWLDPREGGNYDLVAYPLLDAPNGIDGLNVSGMSFEASMPIHTIGQLLDANELNARARQATRQQQVFEERLASAHTTLAETWPLRSEVEEKLARYEAICASDPPLPDKMDFRFRWD